MAAAANSSGARSLTEWSARCARDAARQSPQSADVLCLYAHIEALCTLMESQIARWPRRRRVAAVDALSSVALSTRFDLTTARLCVAVGSNNNATVAWRMRAAAHRLRDKRALVLRAFTAQRKGASGLAHNEWTLCAAATLDGRRRFERLLDLTLALPALAAQR